MPGAWREEGNEWWRDRGGESGREEEREVGREGGWERGSEGGRKGMGGGEIGVIPLEYNHAGAHHRDVFVLVPLDRGQ